MSPKWRGFLAVFLLALSGDQAAKWAVRSYLQPAEPMPLIGSFLSLLREDSPPRLFGVLGELPLPVLCGFLGIGFLLLAALLIRSDATDGLAGTALGLILGGAAGNALDRFYFEQVIDFVRWDFGLFVFPLFNLADAWIVMGMGTLLLDIVASEASEAALSEDADL